VITIGESPETAGASGASGVFPVSEEIEEAGADPPHAVNMANIHIDSKSARDFFLLINKPSLSFYMIASVSRCVNPYS